MKDSPGGFLTLAGDLMAKLRGVIPTPLSPPPPPCLPPLVAGVGPSSLGLQLEGGEPATGGRNGAMGLVDKKAWLGARTWAQISEDFFATKSLLEPEVLQRVQASSDTEQASTPTALVCPPIMAAARLLTLPGLASCWPSLNPGPGAAAAGRLLGGDAGGGMQAAAEGPGAAGSMFCGSPSPPLLHLRRACERNRDVGNRSIDHQGWTYSYTNREWINGIGGILASGRLT